MTAAGISQALLFILSASAIWMLGRKETWRRAGFIVGLCSQPFWFYSVIGTGQWGIFLLSVWYTYSWMQGIYNHWIKVDDENFIKLAHCMLFHRDYHHVKKRYGYGRYRNVCDYCKSEWDS